MLIRTHLSEQGSSWSDALLGTNPRPALEATGIGAPLSKQPSAQHSVAAAPASSGDQPPLDRERTVDAQPPQEEGLEAAQAEQELALIRKLKARDRQVRAHEQAHATVGGPYAGAATFTYQRGPDGVLYAVGGEVSIDVSPIPGNPQATLDKAIQVRRAALAPRDPSSTDRRVAQRAQNLAREARVALAELAALERETAPTAEEKVESALRRIDTTA